MVELASPLVERTTRGRRYLRFQNRYGGEWLFPAERRHRRAAMELYRPFALGGHLRRALMAVGLGGATVSLEEGSLRSLEAAVAGALGRSQVRLAFYASGSLDTRKTSIIAADPSGRPIAFGKSARGAEGIRNLSRERTHLLQLSSDPAFEHSCPSPASWFTHGGNQILLTTLAPARAGPSEFGDVHEAFLGTVRRVHGVSGTFGESALWRQASAQLRLPGTMEDPAWADRFLRAANLLEDRFIGVPITLTLAHRDFAPWNTRLSSHGLYVFDWEFGSHGYPWPHDAFHFRFMTSLLLHHDSSIPTVKRWLDEAMGQRFEADPSLFFLAYLLDVGLQYRAFEVAHQVDPDEPVLKAVAELIDAMAEWLL